MFSLVSLFCGISYIQLTVCNLLFLLYKNTCYHITVCKQMINIINKKVWLKKWLQSIGENIIMILIKHL